MIIEELSLRVLIKIIVYKAIIIKIEAYKESDRRFERLNNSISTDTE